MVDENIPFIVNVQGINGLGRTKGCEKAGEEILKKLKEEIFSNEFFEPINSEELKIEKLELNNDIPFESNERIYSKAKEFFSKEEKIIFLGGDHSISYPLAKAFFEFFNKKQEETCLIVFDAHPDLMPSVDKSMPTHEEWLRQLIEDGFPKENILLIGVRNSDIHESDFIKENKIKIISINSILEDIDNIADTIMEFTQGRKTYLSLDIDVLDPVFAPGTYYQEPGGLSSRELIYLLQRIKNLKNLRAIDVVEINPEKDVNDFTVKLGAKLLAELI